MRNQIATAFVCISIALAGCDLGRATGAETAQKEFQARVAQYEAIQKKAVAGVPALPKEVDDPASITRHERQIAEAIRAARPDAKLGDLFTPDVKEMIVKTIKLKVDGPDGSSIRGAILGEGNPKSETQLVPVNLTANAAYPETAPLSTMPPSLLMALPELPKTLEFRFVGRSLILRDAQANLIVDVIQNAF
jgi:hypothetical protein